MKNLLFLILALAAASPASAAHAARQPITPAENPALKAIRKKYKRWESQREGLKRISLSSASQPSAEGSKAYVYRKSGQVLIVDESYFAEMGQATWSFYYEGKRPFYVLVTETRYAYPITVSAADRKKLGGAEDKTTENRYYFKGGKLIRWLEGKKTIPTRGERFREQAKSVLELASSAFRNALPGGKAWTR
jgi:hypothetical protein